MGISRTISLEYRNSNVNGNAFTDNPSSFAPNLVGNIGQNAQATLSITVSWDSEASATVQWSLDSTTLERAAGSFLDDGFRAGQEFEMFTGGASDFTASIDAISADGSTITFTVLTGAVTAGDYTDAEIKALGGATANQFDAIRYRFGLIPNSDAFSIDSLISETPQRYGLSGLSGSLQSMTALGTLQDWVTGSSQARLASTGTYTQTYEVVHEFIIAPWYLAGQDAQILAGNPPDYFLGEECLKHAFEIELRPTVSDVNGAISARVDDVEGYTGWYNENLNGGTPDYTLKSISYVDTASGDAVESLQLDSKTTVTITLEGAFSGSRVGLIHSYLAGEDEYAGTTSTALRNFLFDSLYVDQGASDTGAGIIKSISANLSGSDLEIMADLEFATDEATTADGGSYLLFVDVATPSAGVASSDAVTVRCELTEYQALESLGLIQLDSFEVLFGDEANDVTLDGSTDFVGWDQDALLLDFTFSLETAKSAILNSLAVDLIAYNDTDNVEFLLDSYDMDISSAVISGGIQQIAVETERGYRYSDSNALNTVSIANGSLSGTLQAYDVQIAQKIRWEDWIKNVNADPVFFDSAELNNNLNFKASNYSGLENYTIRAKIRANVSGEDAIGVERSEDYEFISPTFTIYDYDTNGIDFTATIETFRASNNDDLGGAILADEDTLVRATFTNTVAPLTTLLDVWAAIRLQEYGGLGQQNSELSNDYILDGDLLKPKDGFSFLDLALDSGDVVAECLIDGEQVSAGTQYLLTARIKTPAFIYVLFQDGDGALYQDEDPAQFQDQ